MTTPPAAPPAASPRRTPRLVRWVDTGVRRVITFFGVAVIALVLGMFVFILMEALPLFERPVARVQGEVALPAGRVQALGLDGWGESAWSVGERPEITVVDLPNLAQQEGDTSLQRAAARPPRTLPIELPPLDPTKVEVPPPTITSAGHQGESLALGLSDGRVWTGQLIWETTFEGDERRVDLQIKADGVMEVDAAHGPIGLVALAREQERLVVAAVTSAGALKVRAVEIKESLLGDVTREELDLALVGAPTAGITSLALDEAARRLAVGGEGGVHVWDLSNPEAPAEEIRTSSPARQVSFLLGGESLAVAEESGALGAWLRADGADGVRRFTPVTALAHAGEALVALQAGHRTRSFVSLSESGALALHHRTSGRSWPLTRVKAGAVVRFSPKEEHLGLATDGQLVVWRVENEHPEISLTTLFGPVWYEGYHGAEYVWQSTGGSEDFEPKFSLAPLVFGTLKGTFYALLFAGPLGVMAAIFTSLFLDARTRRWVKPTIEVMASLPSVVLGFLAALWLAPRLAGHIPSLLVALVLIPVGAVATGFGWMSLPRATRARLPGWAPMLALAGALWGVSLLSAPLGRVLEGVAFGGDFGAWLAGGGTTLDRRNSIVVAFALGFAVVPLIYTLSEDALAAVPASLKSASLACGASLWQTAVRVMVPAAASGILSAIMIGFGRAVGETMIVLMATGNTPILDPSIFNGFRTLSANIAVELPEAPVGGSLYRLLFLSALLLFALTFVVNTTAEIIRSRLRARFKAL